MRWYEYKMEVDDLHAPDDLKAKLLAMQAAEATETSAETEVPQSEPQVAAKPNPAKKKPPIHFPLKRMGALAACFAVCVAGYGALSTGMLDLGAKSSGIAEYSASSTAASYAPRAVVDAPQTTAYGADYSADYALEGSASAENSVSTLSAEEAAAVESKSSTSSSKIIYTANLTLESKDYDSAREALDEALAAADGYLESSSEYTNGDSSRSIDLTLRIPEENYDSFLAAAAQAGNVTCKTQQAEDVTTQYMDVEARLSNLEAQRSRLQELEAQADNLSDLIEIESSLSDVQYQIESWQSQLDWYSQQVEQCTVYVTLNEVTTYSPETESFGARLAAALGNGWQAFISGLQQLAVGILYHLPALVLLGAAVAAGVLWYRRKKHPRQ